MKKFLFIMMTFLAVLTLASCGSGSKYYFAVEETNPDSDWVYWVTVEKKGKKIVDVKWNAFNVAGDSDEKFKGMDKYQASVEGLYDMHAFEQDRDGKLWWHEQADLLIDKLIETQDVNDRIPAPTGATITNDNFYELVEKALASDPVKKGKYKNGYHFVTLKNDAVTGNVKEFYDPGKEEIVSTGEYKSHTFGSIVVLNGSIVYAYYNNVFYGYRLQLAPSGFPTSIKLPEDAPEAEQKSYQITVPNATLIKTKNQLGKSYTMGAIMNTMEYDEQAKNAGIYLVEHQGFPELVKNDNDYLIIDGYTGCTIDADDFREIWLKLPKN